MDQEELEKEEKSLWHNRDYLILWSGQTISSFGSQASHVVLPLLILSLTHSPAQAGFIGAFTIIPYVAFSLFAGAFSDRINRKNVMIFCDIGRFLAFGGIAIAIFFGHISIILLYLAAIIDGVCFVFFDIAEIASFRKVVGTKHVSAATAQSSTTDGIAAFLGPPVGATLYQIGQAVPFLIDSISYVISAFSLFLMKTEFQEVRTIEKINLKKDLLEGLSWLFHNKVIRTMAIINAGISFAFSNWYLILIVLAKEQHANPLQIGAIFSIAAIGSIVGSIMGSHLHKTYNPGQLIVTLGWIQAIVWFLYIFSHNIIFIGIIAAILSFIGSVWAIVQISYRVSLVPDVLQGRVNSVFRFIVYSMIPLGMAITGILLQIYGARFTVLIFFFILMAFAAIATLNKDLRNAKNAVSVV